MANGFFDIRLKGGKIWTCLTENVMHGFSSRIEKAPVLTDKKWKAHIFFGGNPCISLFCSPPVLISRPSRKFGPLSLESKGYFQPVKAANVSSRLVAKGPKKSLEAAFCKKNDWPQISGSESLRSSWELSSLSVKETGESKMQTVKPTLQFTYKQRKALLK